MYESFFLQALGEQVWQAVEVGWIKPKDAPVDWDDATIIEAVLRPHVCHHCGVSGHIRPNCFKLYPHKQLSKRSQVSSQGPTPLFGELLKVLSFLTQFQENFNSSMSFSRHTRTCAFSSSRPKTSAVWVRKEPKA